MISYWNQPVNLDLWNKAASVWGGGLDPYLFLWQATCLIPDSSLWGGYLFETDASAIKAKVRHLLYQKKKNQKNLSIYNYSKENVFQSF